MKFESTYEEEIRAFRKYITYLLNKAWEEENKGNNAPIETLYNETFKLSFKGATIEIAFGACEFQAIEDCLFRIEEEC